MAFFKEFKEFALKGNVMDMAVGVIIGGAFGKIVSSLVNDVLMPPIGVLIGNADFSNLKLDISRVRDAVAAGTDFLSHDAAAAATTHEPVYLCLLRVPDGEAHEPHNTQESGTRACTRTRSVERGASAYRDTRPAQAAERAVETVAGNR